MSTKIAMLLDNPCESDRRVLREALTLQNAGYEIVIYATKDKNLPETDLIDGIKIIRVFPADTFYNYKIDALLKSIVLKILDEGYTILHCHDQAMLHVAGLAKHERKFILVYDSHEIFHKQPTNQANSKDYWILFKTKILRFILNRREKRNAKHIDYLITVNQSLQEYLGKYFNIAADKIIFTRNTPELTPLNTDNYSIRKAFGIADATNILVFIGSKIFTKTLNLEQVITELANVPNTAIVFITGEGAGKNEMMQWVDKMQFKNIYFHKSIPHTVISETLHNCTMGLVPTWNKYDLSYWYALDNKLFEYVHAQIPILATQQPEYKYIVEQYNIGVCVNPDEPNAYLKGFQEIVKNWDLYRANLVKAKEVLNWAEEKKLVAFYEMIVDC